MSEPAHRNRNLSHFHLKDSAKPTEYTSRTKNLSALPSPKRPDDVVGHSNRLKKELQEAIETSRRLASEAGIGAAPVAGGNYLTVSGRDGFAPEIEKLESAGLIVVAFPDVQENISDGAGSENGPTPGEGLVTVFIPDGKLEGVRKRLKEYAASPEKPKNERLVNRIGRFRRATLRMLWTDSPSLFPDSQETIWWEVWLRDTRSGSVVEHFQTLARRDKLDMGREVLSFPERFVLLVRATPEQLELLMLECGELAELRRASTNPQVFCDLPNVDQGEYARDLAARLEAAEPTAPAVCILDTGVNQGHPLLTDSLSPGDVHTADIAWGTADHYGHGTQMAGLALFGGELPRLLESSVRVTLRHRLESAKILPPRGQTQPELYGAKTSNAVNEIEGHAPHRQVRTFSMAVTNDELHLPGEPTSWSAAVDALAAGRIINPDGPALKYDSESGATPRRLFLISTGNIDIPKIEHLDESRKSPVLDPAHAWNALTVGAYTDKCEADLGSAFAPGSTVVAKRGSLSPYSRTSVHEGFSGWPIKPEILMEGGNKVIEPGASAGLSTEHLELLTTSGNFNTTHFTTTKMTSAAVSQAAHMAARIQAHHLNWWPETIRALLVHSARWTSEMEKQLPGRCTKGEADRFVRTFGFGVPDLDRALRSAKDALTLVLEDEILPYRESSYGDMNFYSLPWPKNELERLSGNTVKLRVTLSYFIDPYPVRKEKERQARYASAHLRFDLNRALEEPRAFLLRINGKEKDQKRDKAPKDQGDWLLGPEKRHVGSLHHDIWTGNAGELAKKNTLAVTPVAGWMKDAPKKREGRDKLRYALVVSIETTDVEADLWAEVEQQIKVPVGVTVARSSGERQQASVVREVH